MKGLNIAKRVGLQLEECKSFFEKVRCAEVSLKAVEQLLQEKFRQDTAIFVAWQIQSIVWGKYENGQLKLSENNLPEVEFWLESRIFNEVEELHLKNLRGELVGRYVRDEVGEGNFFTDSFSRFWGKNDGAAGGYINLLDADRKLQMKIPCADFSANWYGLLTRNYIDSDEKTGLSGYVDYRFVAIESAGGGVNYER